MTVYKGAIQPPQGSFPLHLFMKLVWTNPRACFGTDIEAAPICVADNYPGSIR